MARVELRGKVLPGSRPPQASTCRVSLCKRPRLSWLKEVAGKKQEVSVTKASATCRSKQPEEVVVKNKVALVYVGNLHLARVFVEHTGSCEYLFAQGRSHQVRLSGTVAVRLAGAKSVTTASSGSLLLKLRRFTNGFTSRVPWILG